MFKLLRRLLNKKDPVVNEKEKELFDFGETTLEHAGHKFRLINPFSNDFVLSKRNQYFTVQHELEWGIMKEDIQKFLATSVNICERKDAFDDLSEQIAVLENKLADVKTMMTQLFLIIKEDYQFKPFLRSAAVIVLMDDEKPEDDYMLTLDKKMDLCAKHPEIESFFLSAIVILHYRLRNREEISKRLEYLKETMRGQKKQERTLYSLIRSKLYPDTTSIKKSQSTSTGQDL